MEIKVKTKLTVRKDTRANWSNKNPVLLSGEIGYETDTGKFKIGDGINVWQKLKYFAYDKFIAVEDTPTEYDLNRCDAGTIWCDLSSGNLYIHGLSLEHGRSWQRFLTENDPARISGNYIRPPDIQVSFQTMPPQKRSTLFPNETDSIINGKLLFRPMCTIQEFKAIGRHLCVGLVRSNKRRGNMKDAGQKRRTERTCHIVGVCSNSTKPEYCYPARSFFNNEDNKVVWTPAQNLVPTPVSQLCDLESYAGSYIEFPYDLETILRRFIYIKKSMDLNNYEILPITDIRKNTDAKLKISGTPNEMDLGEERTQSNQFSVSTTLGICFCMMPEPDAGLPVILGTPVFFRGHIVTPDIDCILYGAGMNGSRRFIKNNNKILR